MPNKWRTIISWVHKIRLHCRRGKGKAESCSREKLDKHHRRKVNEKSCVTFLLCDPGWYVHKPGVQNKWEDNTLLIFSIKLPSLLTVTLSIFLISVIIIYLLTWPETTQRSLAKLIAAWFQLPAFSTSG